MAIGNKVGTLKGLPVYKMNVGQWNLSDTSHNECLYWVGHMLFYHDQSVGSVTDNGTVDLNEQKLEELKQKWASPQPVETRPVEEPKPDNDPVEPDRPQNDLVDAMLGRADWSIKDLLKKGRMAADEYLASREEA